MNLIFGASALAAVIYFLISKFIRDWELADHYQQELYTLAKRFIDDETVPDEAAAFALSLFRCATAKMGTLGFVVTLAFIDVLPGAKDQRSKPPVSRHLTHSQKEELAKMLFAMAMVLERKSILFGWLVFPLILSDRSSKTKHPVSFNDAIRSNRIVRSMSAAS